MSRVAVFYSLGPHFVKALEGARTLGDHVTAIVPKSYALSDREAMLSDETWRLEWDRYGGGEVFVLLRAIRRKKYDAFVVMFRSPKLRMIASLSGASTMWYCAPHGYLMALQDLPLGILAGEALRRIRGLLTYGMVWLSVRARPVAPRSSPDRKGSPRR